MPSKRRTKVLSDRAVVSGWRFLSGEDGDPGKIRAPKASYTQDLRQVSDGAANSRAPGPPSPSAWRFLPTSHCI